MTLFHLDGVGRPPDNRMEMLKTDVKRSLTPEEGVVEQQEVKRLKTGSEVDRNSPDEVNQNHTGVLESQRVSSPINHQLESSENSLSQPPTLESPSANLTPNGTVSGDLQTLVTATEGVLNSGESWVMSGVPHPLTGEQGKSLVDLQNPGFFASVLNSARAVTYPHLVPVAASDPSEESSPSTPTPAESSASEPATTTMQAYQNASSWPVYPPTAQSYVPQYQDIKLNKQNAQMGVSYPGCGTNFDPNSQAFSFSKYANIL